MKCKKEKQINRNSWLFENYIFLDAHICMHCMYIVHQLGKKDREKRKRKKKEKKNRIRKKKLFQIVRVCLVLLFNLWASLGAHFAASFRWVFMRTSQFYCLMVENFISQFKWMYVDSFLFRCYSALFFPLCSIAWPSHCWLCYGYMAKSLAHMWITSSWLFRVINRCVKGFFFLLSSYFVECMWRFVRALCAHLPIHGGNLFLLVAI